MSLFLKTILLSVIVAIGASHMVTTFAGEHTLYASLQNHTDYDLMLTPYPKGCAKWAFKSKKIILRARTKDKSITADLSACHLPSFVFEITFHVRPMLGATGLRRIASRFNFSCGSDVMGCGTTHTGFPIKVNKKKICFEDVGITDPWTFRFYQKNCH